MVHFEVSYSDLQVFMDILTKNNLNIHGLRHVHMFNLIQKILHQYKFHTAESLFHNLDNNPDLIQTCRELLCMSTGEFFRDASLWIQLKSIVHKIAEQDKIHILFSRTSTGEELYSLLIFLQAQGILEKTIIHATEICNNVLEQAKRAVYTLKTIESAEKVYEEIRLSKHLKEYFDISGNTATLKPNLTQSCTFFVQNIQNIIPVRNQQYDIVWYRNQLMYWNKETANSHLIQITDILKKGGYLLTGYVENLQIYPAVHNFEIISFEDKIYRKK